MPRSDPLRVGIVDYLNSRPLARGLLDGRGPAWLEPSCHPPAEVARRLAAGEIDVGLIPSIEVLRIAGLTVLPGACVAATREVRSVLLLSRRPVAAVERVALDLNSRTSAALVRILFADRFGVEPEFVQHPPDPERMLEVCDAALIIGDPALQVSRAEGVQVWDLAAEWRGMTGLPFVFAVWAARSGVDTAGLADLFRDSLATGVTELDAIGREAVAELGLERADVDRYLRVNLRYELGDEELAGLSEFYRRAGRHGLVPSGRSLRLAEGRPAAAPTASGSDA